MVFFEDLEIEGLKLIKTEKHPDARGFFSETYNAVTWQQAGLDYNFVQDNHSLSRDVGTLRGLHYQLEPFAQDKLIRVLRGRILDVAVDLRRSSPTFKKYVAVELSCENWCQLFIPVGFAHGFLTLEPDTEVLYKVTNFYSPAHEFGVAWDDPELGIQWPINNEIILSEKDKKLPFTSNVENFFREK
jgi:dTDP-4-dehydrorhamnose 3,5-epimerase